MPDEAIGEPRDDPARDQRQPLSARHAPRDIPLSGWSRSKYAQISKLLDEALEFGSEARSEWLETLERHDPDLAAELRSLLTAPEESRVERTLAGADDLADQLAALPEANRSLVGRRYGPYCVRSLLGHGGMGSVWLAERVDGLFARQVALKLVHPALMSRGLAERMSRERAILARLDNPNIGRLYDAGVSDDGQPYLALEFVAGSPFGAFCDGRRLGVRERLQLFQQVLSAVRYAHSHLVIHRDLKPSNILVTDEGRVCLLDFGISKLFGEAAIRETDLTQLSGRALSLDYAAPEQIAGAQITIATDIYALGVMLYELLSGQGPYKLTRRSRATLEDAILWMDPAPLSRLIASETVADARAATVRRLTRTLRGDLDTIVMKALQKLPAKRYATVDALGEDIARWLRSEPILARRDTIGYRAAKFARRHWVAMIVCAAFVITLIGGLAATTYEAKVAEEQRDAAFRAQLRLLTQTAAARLKDGDTVAALNIILEVLRHPGASGSDSSDALAVFQEARAADSQILALTPKTDVRGEWPSSVAFFPDGRRIVTTSSDDAAFIWDAATGHELLALKQHAAHIDGALFSPEGLRLYTVSAANTLRIWGAYGGQETLELKGHTDQIASTEFSSDGRRIVTASLDKTARIWNAATGKELLKLAHDDKVFDARFSSDGLRVVTASHDRIARIWDARTGRNILRLVGHKDNVFAAAFSHDGRHIVTASADSTARLWDAATGRVIVPLSGHDDGLVDASYSPDDRYVVTASGDHTARIWDARYGRQIAVLAHPEQVWEAVFSPDGRYVATASLDGSARVWDVSEDSQSLLVTKHPEQVSAAAFSPDGRHILTASFDRTAVIWDAQTARRLATLRGHSDRIWSSTFSPDGGRIATGSRDRTARIWDAETGQELLQLTGHMSGVRSVAFSRDGHRIVTAAHDKTARIWDTTTGRELLRLTGHSNEVQWAAFSPDSRQVITASSDKTARIWDAGTGRELLRLEGHTDAVNSAAFSPDGRRVATASNDRTVRIWDTATGHELLQLRGHKDGILDAQFSPDGERIVTASHDRSIRVWDTATGHAIMLYRGHNDEVFTAVFSPDGSRIISASADNTARVWDAHISTLDHQIAWAEAAQFELLSSSARFAMGLPPTTGDAYPLPDDGARRERGYRGPSESREPTSLALLAEEADTAALLAKTDNEKNTHSLEAFRYFAAAAARAQGKGWPDGAWRRWRYRRASLARLLARSGMMDQAAEIYENVRARNAPQPASLWDRLAGHAGMGSHASLLQPVLTFERPPQ